MIPTIEDILAGLASGQYTVEQARRWIARHIQMAEERVATAGVQGVGANTVPHHTPMVGKDEQ
jgi:hypothetical protein